MVNLPYPCAEDFSDPIDPEGPARATPRSLDDLLLLLLLLLLLMVILDIQTLLVKSRVDMSGQSLRGHVSWWLTM